MSWEGKKITVMGLGLLGGGVGTAMFFAQRGAKVTITDLRDAETLRPSIEKLREFSITYVLGEHREQDFVNAELIVKNPGVPDSSPFLVAARRAGVPIETEASFFLKEVSGINQSANSPIGRSIFVIGVTGTKGKTTTAHFITEGLRACGVQSYLTGVPGTSFLGTLANLQTSKLADSRTGRLGDLQISRSADLQNSRLDQSANLPINQSAIIVAEFSSWDLESIAPHKISPPIAVVTNLFPDHLNRHGTMEAYREAKAAIFDHQKPQDSAVVLASEVFLRERMMEVSGKAVIISEGDIAALPRLKIPGPHMRRNAALAFAAVRETITHKNFPLHDTVQFDGERVRAALVNFSGAPGRLERIRTFSGRDFINDTTATNPGALLAALEAFDRPLVVIVGGEDKGLSYNRALAAALCKKTKQVILLPGTASGKIRSEFTQAGCSKRCRIVANMPEAVHAAWKASVEGDIILLSPGAASFNLFKNEFERGDAFLAEVMRLAEE